MGLGWPTALCGRRAFSLVELVMVVIIISIIAAIAVPRVTSASRNAEANALEATMANVRAAIDHYYAEHGKYPGYNPANGNPNGDWFIKQLTMYSDQSGDVSDTPSSKHPYGPYLRKPFPTNPRNSKSTVKVKKLAATNVVVATTGWIACIEDGSFTASTPASLPAEGEVKLPAEGGL